MAASPIEGKELITIALGQSEQIATYWNLYIAVSGALIGLLASADRMPTSAAGRTAVSVLFGLFSASNLYAMFTVYEVRRVALCMINDVQLQPLKSVAVGSPFWKLTLFHMLFDAAIVAFIWLFPRIRNRSTAGEPGRTLQTP